MIDSWTYRILLKPQSTWTEQEAAHIAQEQAARQRLTVRGPSQDVSGSAVDLSNAHVQGGEGDDK